MADRYFFDVQSLKPELKIVAGNFKGADATDEVGPGFTASHEGTGLYKINLDDKYDALLASTFNFSLAAANQVSAQLTDNGLVSGNAVSFRVIDESNTLTDLTGTDRIEFALFLSNTGID